MQACSTRKLQSRVRILPQWKDIQIFAFLVVLGLFAVMPTLAQSDSIEVDTGTLLTNINLWIPIMFAILALPAGIRIAMRVVNFIIDAFVDAFR